MVGFSVPKKKFKSSVHRHRVRRLMVEAWRLNKHMVYGDIPGELQLHMFFIFTDDKLPEYDTVARSMLLCIEKLRALPQFSTITNKEQ